MIIGASGWVVFGITMLMVLAAQGMVKLAYSKYSKVGARSGMTGADVARMMMRDENITDVDLECIGGKMTDHYDPRAKVVRLSEDVYHGRSLAALGIAAHEVGHVIQHANNYAPMQLRQFIYPVSNIGTGIGPWLVIGGLFLSLPQLMWAGVYLFAAATAFTVITLPVEFDATWRAKRVLASEGVLSQDEMRGAGAVLNAAAMTYVAAAAASIMWLLHYIMLAQSRD